MADSGSAPDAISRVDATPWMESHREACLSRLTQRDAATHIGREASPSTERVTADRQNEHLEAQLISEVAQDGRKQGS